MLEIDQQVAVRRVYDLVVDALLDGIGDETPVLDLTVAQCEQFSAFLVLFLSKCLVDVTPEFENDS